LDLRTITPPHEPRKRLYHRRAMHGGKEKREKNRTLETDPSQASVQALEAQGKRGAAPADTGSWCRRVQGCIAVSKGAEGEEGNRLTFGRRRKLNFICREKCILWAALSRKWSLSPPLAQANLGRGGLFLLHIHIFFASVRLGLGLLLSARLCLAAPAAAGLARRTSGSSFGWRLFSH
jgi:hypothetical protein